jgi:carboxyl-terminal processing protease
MTRATSLPLWFLLANMALVGGAFVLGVNLGSRRTAGLPDEQLAALAIVHREILQSHVEPQDGAQLLEHAIAGMVEALDPYSRYIRPADVADYEERNTGHYEGIGADFAVHDDRIVLRFPLAGGAAERAGLLPGDVLLAVDGVELDTPSQRERVVDLVRGPADSTVRLRLLRDGATFEATLRRGDVQRPCIKWAHLVVAEEGLGYVHLTDFHPGAARQLFAAVDDLLGQGLRGLVLDLRWNGGGSLEECIAIARGFVRKGTIVTQTRRGGEVVERHEAMPEQCRFTTLPLVLLVNERSASASEVLCGALQDHRRAAIVGERTHGKAYVNTVYTWKNKPFRLKLTTGKYQTPLGRDIERRRTTEGGETGGITPDVVVALPAEQRSAVQAALRASEPPPAWREAFRAMAARTGMPVPTPPTPAGDAQFAAALPELRARLPRDPDGR